MSAVVSASQLISPEDYLAGELLSEERHEYIAGVIRSMPCSNAVHCHIGGNIRGLLHGHLRGGTCSVFGINLKLRLEFPEGTVFYYPDAMVCCDPTDDAEYYRQRPVLIVEILSPQTARVDQREKFLAYQTIPSLEVYVMVDQDACRLIIHRRDNDWQAEFLTEPDGILTVPGLGWSVPLKDIYERTGLAG
ncbi:MAG: Uma2 family endonuclease [Verrucomicrobiota bacterium]